MFCTSLFLNPSLVQIREPDAGCVANISWQDYSQTLSLVALLCRYSVQGRFCESCPDTLPMRESIPIIVIVGLVFLLAWMTSPVWSDTSSIVGKVRLVLQNIDIISPMFHQGCERPIFSVAACLEACWFRTAVHCTMHNCVQ